MADPLHVSAKELHDHVRDHCDHALHILTRAHTRNYTPTVIVTSAAIGNKKEQAYLFVLAMPFNEHEEKRSAMSGVGKHIFSLHAVPRIVTFSSEAWLSRQDIDDMRKIQPRDDPDRQEVIVISGADLLRRQGIICIIPLTRDSRDVIIAGKPSEVMNSSDCQIIDWVFDAFVDESSKYIEDRKSRKRGK